MTVGINSTGFTRASILNRFVAKVIDLIIAAALSKLISPVGIFAGFIYLLISDGLLDGRSIGKKVIKLKTLREDGASCAFRESIIRNSTVAGGYIFFFIPYVGWILTLIIYCIEGLVTIGNEKGFRIGDELARTYVIENGGK